MISEALFAQLKPLLAFRHFYRHSYSFSIVGPRMRQVALDANKIAEQFREEISLLLET